MKYASGMICKLCNKKLTNVSKAEWFGDFEGKGKAFDLSAGGRLFLLCRTCENKFWDSLDNYSLYDGVIIGKKAPSIIINMIEKLANNEIEICPQCNRYHELYFLTEL
jgi:uncharacterized protein with PIN domain